jgi:ribosomal-protein-alanine N-acetyltransferase
MRSDGCAKRQFSLLKIMMPSNYLFCSEHLGFREWRDDDFGLALRLWSDAEVTRYIGGPYSEDRVHERLAREIANMTDFRVQYWPVFLLNDGTNIGCCGLSPYKMDEGIYEIGIHLHTAFQKQGYGREAILKVMLRAFRNLNAMALFAGHHPENKHSRHFIEQFGFRYTHDEFYPPTGLNHPSYLLTVEEWEERYG